VTEARLAGAAPLVPRVVPAPPRAIEPGAAVKRRRKHSVRRNFGVPLAALVAALGGLAIAAYGLALPHSLFGVHDYDDGVYFGAALRLTEGLLPYRRFVLLHPPGITLLLAPLALLGRAVGSRDALAVARVLTALVAGGNCALVAYVVRHRGAIASLGAGLALACFPLAVTGDQTVLLEPYLAAFCLIGALLAFQRGELVVGRRALVAGSAFGLAGAIKLWALFPILALLCCCAGRWRRSAVPLVAGILAGFLLPCLPFALAAPRAFLHDVVVAQLHRSAGTAGLSLIERLGALTGLSGLPSVHASPHEIAATAGALAASVVCTFAIGWRGSTRCDWFLLAASALSVGAVLASREFYEYYAYFPSVFLAATLGVCAGRWADTLERVARRAGARRGRRQSGAGASPELAAGARGAPRVVAALAVCLLAALSVPFDVGATHAYIEAGSPSDPSALVDRTIPPGSCVVSDDVIKLIVSDRFVSSAACPAIVDPYGTWLAADPVSAPPSPGSDVPGLAAAWRAWLGRARYLVESVPGSDFIPWTSSLSSWFAANFRLVASAAGAYIYARATGSAAVAPTGSSPHSPRLFAATVRAGVAASAAGELALARQDFTVSTRLEPDNPIGYFDLGVVDARAGDDGRAQRDYEHALSLDGHDKGALYNLAVLFTLVSRARAVSLYRQVLAIDARNADARLNLGFVLLGEGHAASGEHELQEAVALDPALRSRVPASLHLP
jgi:alpha-1,2-mannosyltransferase